CRYVWLCVSSNPPPGLKTGYQTHDGHISQIPGLSPSISTLSEERARGRRVAVLDSDSDYVKLAKQGGHKGLLWHEETISSKPISYKPADWFCSELGDFSKPRSEGKKSPGALQPLEPPFGTDAMSTWERDNGSSNGKEKCTDAHFSQMEELQRSHRDTSKFKRIIFEKKAAPVDMSKLLSFGYAEDNRPAGIELEDSQVNTGRTSGLLEE
ncbi:uncharacterized protein C7orf57 homolog, partial [Xenentodon cancila]